MAESAEKRERLKRMRLSLVTPPSEVKVRWTPCERAGKARAREPDGEQRVSTH